jgi:peptidoglycan hydrolase-like protein with peptidoglycan-binding domain
MALRSNLFKGDAKLEAAAESDPAHITRGASGEHVRKIQIALIRLDDADIEADGRFGPRTEAAVLAFKRRRDIVNRSYQSQADAIVGKMTMVALDSEMLAAEDSEDDNDTSIGPAVLEVLAHLDRILLRKGVTPSPRIRFAVEGVRVSARNISAVSKPLSGEMQGALHQGLRQLNDLDLPNTTPTARSQFGFAPLAPAAAPAGAVAITLLTLAVILLTLATVALATPGGRKRAGELFASIVELATQAVIAAVNAINVANQRVDACRRIANKDPRCLDALSRFEAKSLEVGAKQAQLGSLIKLVSSGMNPVFLGPVFQELLKLLDELDAVVEEVLDLCGCRFAGRNIPNKPPPGVNVGRIP